MSHNSASLATMSLDLSTSTSHHVIFAHRSTDLLSCRVVTAPHCFTFCAPIYSQSTPGPHLSFKPPSLPLILNFHKQIQRSGFVYASGRTVEHIYSAGQPNVNVKMLNV